MVEIARSRLVAALRARRHVNARHGRAPCHALGRRRGAAQPGRLRAARARAVRRLVDARRLGEVDRARVEVRAARAGRRQRLEAIPRGGLARGDAVALRRAGGRGAEMQEAVAPLVGPGVAHMAKEGGREESLRVSPSVTPCTVGYTDG